MLPFGLIGQVTTVIVASLPFGAFRSPAVILYERRLEYRPLAVVDIVETSVYYVWAIATISVGWGVWGLATACVVRALAGMTILLTLVPEGRIAPVPSWTKVRGLLGFGVRYQAVGLLHMLRDQGVNIAVGAFGGVAMLGLWNVAWRIIQMPVSLFAALVARFVSRDVEACRGNEELGSTIERVIGLVAIGTGVARRAARGFCLSVDPRAHGGRVGRCRLGDPAGVFRDGVRCADLGGACGLPLGDRVRVGPAARDGRWNPATLLLLLALLPFIGVAAAGIAYIASSLVESVFFVFAARHTTTFTIGRVWPSRWRLGSLRRSRLGRRAMARTRSGWRVGELGGCARRVRRRPRGASPHGPLRRLGAGSARAARRGGESGHRATRAGDKLTVCRRPARRRRWLDLADVNPRAGASYGSAGLRNTAVYRVSHSARRGSRGSRPHQRIGQSARTNGSPSWISARSSGIGSQPSSMRDLGANVQIDAGDEQMPTAVRQRCHIPQAGPGIRRAACGTGSC